MIHGNKVSLRALEREDLPVLQEWRNHENFRRCFREYRELSMEHQRDWFEKLVIADYRTLMFGIIDNAGNELIGVNGLCYIDWVGRNADLSLYIGRNNLYVDTHKGGLAWDSLDLLCSYGFNILNLHKIWTEIYEFDEKKHVLYEGYGLNLDAVLRDNCFHKGRYWNSHIYSILADEWRGKHPLEN